MSAINHYGRLAKFAAAATFAFGISSQIPAHRQLERTDLSHVTPNIFSLTSFIKNYESKIAGLDRDREWARFSAALSGKKEDHERAAQLDAQINQVHCNKDEFATISEFRSAGIKDTILRRQLDILYLSYLEGQVDGSKTGPLETDIKTAMAAYKRLYKVGNQMLTEQEVKILNPPLSAEESGRIAWEAKVGIGPGLASKIVQLVKLRNAEAQRLGFSNYYEMKLIIGEQNLTEISRAMELIASSTQEKYLRDKEQADKEIAKYYGIPMERLMPWHYQEMEKVFKSNAPNKTEASPPIDAAHNFYTAIGLPLSNTLRNNVHIVTDGKAQNSSTFNDRDGNIKIVFSHTSLPAVFHEFGHAAFRQGISKELPWLLRQASALINEGVALFFGQVAENSNFEIVSTNTNQAQVSSSQRFSRLYEARRFIAAREFEQKLYENPDQDLNKLWWDLAEKYQGIKSPAPNEPGRADWAYSVGIYTVKYPVYIHNYSLGLMVAAQISHFISSHNLSGKQIGQYLQEKFFAPGLSRTPSETLRLATGEPLNSSYFVSSLTK